MACFLGTEATLPLICVGKAAKSISLLLSMLSLTCRLGSTKWREKIRRSLRPCVTCRNKMAFTVKNG